MNVRAWIAAAGLICAASAALGQAAPEGPGMVISAPPADQGTAGYTAPTPAAPTNTVTLTPPPAPPGAVVDNSLMVAQAGKSMTITLMMGYVNEQPIYANEIFASLDERLTRLGKSARTLAEFEATARVWIREEVRRRISEELLYSAAEATLTPEQRAAIDVQMEMERKAIERHYGGLAAAEKALKAEGSSVARRVAEARRQLVKGLYLSKRIDRNIQITQQMARDEYDRDPKRWQLPEHIEIYTITLPVSRWLREPAANGEPGPVMARPTEEQIRGAEVRALATADEIVQKLKANADQFGKLVQDYNSADENYSRDGKWKPLERGTLRDTNFEKYVFALGENALGAPYMDHQADFRNSKVIVVKVGKKQAAKVTTFIEAQDEIIRDIRRKQLELLQQREMEHLSQGAAIEAVDRMLDVALNAAVSRYATVK